MQRIIDFHTHAFPDEMADKVMKMLEGEGGVKASLDGRISSLLSSMERNGIEKSIVCSIATKPSQFDAILAWSKQVRSERIIPFPSIHPGDERSVERVARIKGEGFKGIKFHPYYQDFDVDEERIFPIYEKAVEENLIVVMHTGYDFAYPRISKADPAKIASVMEKFPELKLVTTHLGAWDQWEEVEKLLLGKRIYMEISFSLEYIKKDVARSIILNHPKDYILFGSDSPWTDQGKTLSLLKDLGLGQKREVLILRDNAVRLLNSV